MRPFAASDSAFCAFGHAFGEDDPGDDQLRGIAESGIEQSSQAFPDAGGERFSGAPDPARDRNDAESGANEERSRTDTPGPEAQKHRERNEDKKPVEGRFEFQKSGNVATCLS